MLFVGIDPGLDGALVVLDAGGMIVQQEVLPVIPAGRGRRTYDVPGLVSMLKTLAETGDLCVTLEQALIFRGQGLASTAAGIGGQRLIEGILAALQIRFQVVHPKTWQRGILTGCAAKDSKAAAQIVAGRLWPHNSWLKSEACRTPHVGLIDAALLAEYGRRTFGCLFREERLPSVTGPVRRRRGAVGSLVSSEVQAS